jgi:hypothetical protein
MTRDEILSMGRKAGAFIELAQEKDLLWLERFAALVAEHERAECAKLCDGMEASTALSDLEKYRTRFIADAIRARSEE